ncbi:HAD hydrolase family protein, partial [bacterium 210820-DFI.6.52]|nr:HAD hydrolase family protein [bacterium 210820-DFI.6.52]
MAIKLICIDMDGTLLMDQQNVSEENKRAIK